MVVELDLRPLAHRQNGLLRYAQLLGAGLTRGQIRARVARGTLIYLGHGVYATADPALLPHAVETAAIIALGEGALLSHRSAAALWQLAAPDPDTVHVTLIARNARPRPGVVIHRARRFHASDLAGRHNLAVTAPARTLIDFACDASSAELSHAFGEARARRLINDPALRSSLVRVHTNHPGRIRVAKLLADGSTYERSRAESLMREHLKAAELPQPLANVMLHGHLVDFLWPEQKLVVEIDGYRTHGSRQAFERDRRRDQALAARGYAVIRITWAQLCNEPLALIARLAQALALRPA